MQVLDCINYEILKGWNKNIKTIGKSEYSNILSTNSRDSSTPVFIWIVAVSGYFETLPSRDSTTSCRLVTSRLLFWILRDYVLDTSRLLVTSRLFIFWILWDYALDASRLFRQIFLHYIMKPNYLKQILCFQHYLKRIWNTNIHH